MCSYISDLRILAISSQMYFVSNYIPDNVFRLQRNPFVASQEPPATWESVDSYSGMTNSADGVIMMLEHCNEDYAALQAELETSENQAQREYEGFKVKSERAIAVAGTDQANAERQKAEDENTLAEAQEDLKAAQNELDAANRYLEKLTPACVYQPPSFEERQAATHKEIQSLREALKILASSSETLEGAGEMAVV